MIDHVHHDVYVRGIVMANTVACILLLKFSVVALRLDEAVCWLRSTFSL